MKAEPKTHHRGRPRTRFQPDVRITVRFRPGQDDDLLAWLEELPIQHRARRIREALRSGLPSTKVKQRVQG